MISLYKLNTRVAGQNFFLLIRSHHDVLEKKKILNKKNRSEIFNLGPPAKPAKQKEQIALEKSLRLHTCGSPAAAAESV